MVKQRTKSGRYFFTLNFILITNVIASVEFFWIDILTDRLKNQTDLG